LQYIHFLEFKQPSKDYGKKRNVHLLKNICFYFLREDKKLYFQDFLWSDDKAEIKHKINPFSLDSLAFIYLYSANKELLPKFLSNKKIS